ncbi:MAG: preprotein translocase subunit YajC [Gammaproteobacteria bacterium]|nr:preprotein translocase subunit YajC [Gammaproteobacteria bacterium]
MSFFIAEAVAAEAPSGGGVGGFDILIIVAFALIFYFIVWRPQSKRSKEHRNLIAGLSKGDEVVTNGGLIGKVLKIEDDFLVFEAADKIELKLQKSAVSAVLPKGTIKSI